MQTAVSCARAGRPYVSGVTDLTTEQLAQLQAAATIISLLYSRNMSVGLNALLPALPVLVRLLWGYDVEIVESNHRRKTDAPSGTALALAQAIAGVPDVELGDHAVFGRHGYGFGATGEIGIHAVRGGGNAGEHEIILSTDGEEIRGTHRAFDRCAFAQGALAPSAFVSCQPAGFYSMADVARTSTP